MLENETWLHVNNEVSVHFVHLRSLVSTYITHNLESTWVKVQNFFNPELLKFKS